MGRTSQAREKILQAARLLFWERGYEGVSMEDLCSAAGVNKGTLYHFYSNKEEIALSAVHSNAELTLGVIQDERLKKMSGLNAILYYFDFTVAMSRERFEESGLVPGCPFGTLGAELGGRNDAICSGVNEWFEKMTEQISEYLKKDGIRSPKKKAEEILMLWQGAMLMAKTANRIEFLHEAREYTVQLIKKK